MANITWRSIYDLNRNGKGADIKDPNLIYPGQTLIMPDGSAYVVKQGDNLTTIAANYNRNITAAPTPQLQNNLPAGNSTPAENRIIDDGLVRPNENNEFPPVIVIGNRIEGGDSPNKRQYNPLSKFSSVTYRASLYALNADSYNSYFTNGKWVLKDMELLVQSAGASASSEESRRNQFFDLDFYIDNLEITTLTNGKETRSAGNTSLIKFQIFEPYAMTFPSRLVAAQEVAQAKAKIKRTIDNETDAMLCPYLLVVRFYGYDAAGNLIVSPVDIPSETTDYSKTDSQAAFERAFPITITKLSFKLEHKTTVYDIEARLLNEQIGYSLKRGFITKPLSIVADTVSSAIGGTDDTKNAQVKGLLDSLNELQSSQLTNPSKGKAKQKLANVYKVYIDPEIGNSLIVDKSFYSKPYTATALVDKVKEVNERTAFLKTQTVSKSLRQINIATGTSILAAIEQIIGQSTYLRDRMVYFDKEETQPTKPEESSVSDVEGNGQTNKKAFEWYSIKPVVKIIGFDRDTKDYAYEVTYVIQKYKVPYLRSLAIQSQTGYYGPNKIYNYWYTGKNTEVLSYDITYNLLYFNTQVLSSEGGITDSQLKDTAPNAALPSTDSSPLGKLPGSQELQNTIKTFLYSPADQVKANIKILGDPDFLMPVESGTLEQALTQWYGPDFSVNSNTGQVFIEIGFNQVIDYDISSGTLPANGKIKVWDYEPIIEDQSEGRMIFMLTRVTSRFYNGVFTQDLKTIVPNFTKTKKPTQGQDSSREKVSSIEETKANIVATIQQNALPVSNRRNTPVADNSTVGNNPTVNDDS